MSEVTYSLHDYPAYKPLKWYNSERREYHGGYIYNNQGSYEYHYEDAYVNTFHLDGTNTSASNKKTTTLFTWANDCYTQLEYYITENSVGIGQYEYTIHGDMSLCDKNGHVLLTSPMSLTTTSNSGSSLDSVILYSTGGATFYNADDDYASLISGFYGTLLVPAGDAPAHSPAGSTFTEQQWTNSYNAFSLRQITSDEDLQASMDLLIDNGDDTPITPILPSDDTSEPGGGDEDNPDYNPFSDTVNFPDLPTGGDSISTGFIRIYTPTAGQLRSLSSVLWSDDFVNTIKKIQNDPMEAIVSLHSVPLNIVGGSSSNCQIGNFSTGVSMPTVTQQFYTVTLGSIHVPEHWASALDYSPYVTIDCYLPFVGVVSLQVDDIIGRTVTVSYNIDIISGATVASIKCGDSVLYTYNTNVILRHPISQSSFGPLYQSILGMVGSTLSGASVGGVGGALGGMVGGALNVALSKHSNVSRGGSIGGATGVMAHYTPYLIIHRPIQSLASGFAHFKGYPSNITTILGSVSGYTEVESVHLNGITCTDSEKAEIEALLYNGVIL